MDRKTLGATLIAATAALGMAGVGCESAEEKAAVETANKSIIALGEIQGRLSTRVIIATGGELFPNQESKFMFTVDAPESNKGVPRKAAVLCSKGLTSFRTMIGDVFQNHDGGRSCAGHVVEPGRQYNDGSAVVFVPPQLVSLEKITHKIVLNTAGMRETATIISDEAGVNVEASLLEHSDCKVNSTKVPVDVCVRVIDAVKAALDGMFRVGEAKGKRLAAEKAESLLNAANTTKMDPPPPMVGPAANVLDTGGGIDN